MHEMKKGVKKKNIIEAWPYELFYLTTPPWTGELFQIIEQ